MVYGLIEVRKYITEVNSSYLQLWSDCGHGVAVEASAHQNVGGHQRGAELQLTHRANPLESGSRLNRHGGGGDLCDTSRLLNATSARRMARGANKCSSGLLVTTRGIAETI